MRPSDVSVQQTYIESLYAPEDQGLKQIRERLVNANRWGINIGAGEGKLLQLLIRLGHVKKAVEIGTLFGYSAVWIARALPDGGRLYTIERDYDSARHAKKAFEECGVQDRITLLEGEAEDKLREISVHGPFDLVFIDANKSAYPEYLDWAVANLRTGGLVVADNTLLGGGVVHNEKPDNLSNRQYNGMRDFNRRLADATVFHSMLLPTSEGLSIALKI